MENVVYCLNSKTSVFTHPLNVHNLQSGERFEKTFVFVDQKCVIHVDGFPEQKTMDSQK